MRACLMKKSIWHSRNPMEREYLIKWSARNPTSQQIAFLTENALEVPANKWQAHVMIQDFIEKRREEDRRLRWSKEQPTPAQLDYLRDHNRMAQNKWEAHEIIASIEGMIGSETWDVP